MAITDVDVDEDVFLSSIHVGCTLPGLRKAGIMEGWKSCLVISRVLRPKPARARRPNPFFPGSPLHFDFPRAQIITTRTFQHSCRDCDKRNNPVTPPSCPLAGICDWQRSKRYVIARGIRVPRMMTTCLSIPLSASLIREGHRGMCARLSGACPGGGCYSEVLACVRRAVLHFRKQASGCSMHPDMMLALVVMKRELHIDRCKMRHAQT